MVALVFVHVSWARLPAIEQPRNVAKHASVVLHDPAAPARFRCLRFGEMSPTHPVSPQGGKYLRRPHTTNRLCDAELEDFPDLVG